MDLFKSGRRDSNPRPSPWQGDALPAELLPHSVLFQTGCKYTPPEIKTKKFICI